MSFFILNFSLLYLVSIIFILSFAIVFFDGETHVYGCYVRRNIIVATNVYIVDVRRYRDASVRALIPNRAISPNFAALIIPVSSLINVRGSAFYCRARWCIFPFFTYMSLVKGPHNDGLRAFTLGSSTVESIQVNKHQDTRLVRL